jgi:hypothetical protein
MPAHDGTGWSLEGKHYVDTAKEYTVKTLDDTESSRLMLEQQLAATNDLEEKKDILLQIVSANRRRALDDGFMHDGVLWDSDANARIAYAELAMRYQYDPAFVTTWKASDGYWVEMTAPLFQAVYAAGAEHVQTCFAWQAAKEVEIKECVTVEELEAVSVVF